MRLISLVLVLALASVAGATHPYVQNVVVRQRIVQPYFAQQVVQVPYVQQIYQPLIQQQVVQQYAPLVQQVQVQHYAQLVQQVQVQAFSNYHAVAVQPIVVRQVQHRSRGGLFGRLFR
jgi:hypothetical protein